ncbi:hypothetical protein SAMN05444521_0481 [Streptomyces sp. 3214.6]|nr:hypothetical protein SAMN05444521_0481 [Streptomyces sp. 3214.6]
MPVITGEAAPCHRAHRHPVGMRRPLALAPVLAAVLLTGGCVSLPSGAPPPPHMAPDAARTPSPVPAPGQASARTALVTTTPTRAPQQHTRGRRVVTERRSAGAEGHPPPHARTPARPDTDPAARPARPAPPGPVTPPPARHRSTAPVAPRHQSPQPRTIQPRPTYDMRTVCEWSHQSPVPPAVRGLCDAYVR